MSVAEKLASKGITLPTPSSPIANYVPTVITGNLLFLSGQISNGLHHGQLGKNVTVEQAVEAARQCVLNGLAQVNKALGSLETINRVVKLTVFVNATPDFNDHPKVGNGASGTDAPSPFPQFR